MYLRMNDIWIAVWQWNASDQKNKEAQWISRIINQNAQVSNIIQVKKCVIKASRPVLFCGYHRADCDFHSQRCFHFSWKNHFRNAAVTSKIVWKCCWLKKWSRPVLWWPIWNIYTKITIVAFLCRFGISKEECSKKHCDAISKIVFF